MVSQETVDRVNTLMAKAFDYNGFSDNVAYNLGFYDYRNIEGIYHEKWAHVFPEMADVLSSLLLSLDARPVRLPIGSYTKDYKGNLVEMFDDNLRAAEEFRAEIIQTLDVAELNDDVEVKLALEDFLEDFVPYRKQAEVWARYAHRYEGNERSFEQRFANLTTIGSAADDDD